ncbi:MAG TPA: hypothetical protein VFU05_10330 [Cyclobacteriaceae bacterium]|nr:hypothetical protein [Cyclobacteriaceae bacterium]
MSFKKATLLILLAELLVGLLAIYNYGFTLEGLQATTRFSGRLSLVIFSLIFIYLTFNREKLASFLSVKPFHVFAIAHGIHLIELLTYVYLSKNELIPIRLAGGFLAYVFIFIMPFIHTQFISERLAPKKYMLAEGIYLYYVWFIFFMSYLPRVQGKLPHAGGNYWEFVVLLCWVCLLIGAKLLSQFNLIPRRSA